MAKRESLIRIPFLLKAFVFFYIGAYGIYSTQYDLNEDAPWLDVVKLVSIVIFSIFFSYGVICFIRDFKDGGIRKVIDKIKNNVQ